MSGQRSKLHSVRYWRMLENSAVDATIKGGGYTMYVTYITVQSMSTFFHNTSLCQFGSRFETRTKIADPAFMSRGWRGIGGQGIQY